MSKKTYLRETETFLNDMNYQEILLRGNEAERVRI